jgi:ribonuclease BN (tRNA processing enzyme)
MKIRVLGCSGAIARDCRTTAFWVDDDILVDAGTGVGDLPLQDMLRIDHVFLTHAHLDHIAALPLMLDAVGARRSAPLQVHALPATLQALRSHIFNGTIWPDFTRIPTPGGPFVQFCPLAVGQRIPVGGKTVEVLPAEHTVPAVGFAISAQPPDNATPAPCWVYTGDTGPNPALWQRVNQLPVQALVIETAFAEQDAALAQLSQHLSPQALAQELTHIAPGHRFPIYITHTKPSQTGQIMDEIRRQDAIPGNGPRHDIRWLQVGYKWQF